MKNFYSYLADVKKEYDYKIKLAFTVTDEILDKIEMVLKKFDVINVETPKKSIIDYDHVDFPNYGAIEVWNIKFTTDRSISPYMLINELKAALNVFEGQIKVRSAADQLETYERFEEEKARIAEREKKNDEDIALLNHVEVADKHNKPAYGDKYNAELLSHLAQIRANRVKREEGEHGYKSTFSWLEEPVDTGSFNDDIKDAPEAVTGKGKKSKETSPPVDVTPLGNFDSTIHHASKTVLTKGGKLKKISGKE